jgi:hypothetical protein
MTVIVYLRTPLTREITSQRHPKGMATLVDARSNLLILDTADLDLAPEFDHQNRALFGKPEMQLIKHTIATYADGEWSSVKTGR